MILGIVGSEAAKFTPRTEQLARIQIRALIAQQLYGGQSVTVCSGRCHLGGIDIWAVEEARAMRCPVIEHPPKRLNWSEGYKPRNMKIAETSDQVVCITLRTLPDSYKGMRFTSCYHCSSNEHVKSGGCWTVKYARNLGKPGTIIVID
jgi:hypothetical protein